MRGLAVVRGPLELGEALDAGRHHVEHEAQQDRGADVRPGTGVGAGGGGRRDEGAETAAGRSEEHTSELQSLMRISYAVFCFKKKTLFQYSWLQNDNYQQVQ